MKKILITLSILVVIAVLAFAVLLLTLDPAQYAPVIEKKLENVLDSEIQYDDINLSWHHGIGLELKNLMIKDRSLEGAPLPIVAEKIRLKLELEPLLRRSIQIGSIEVVSPEIHITKDHEGRIFVGGIKSLFLQPKSASSPGGALSFLIETLEIKKANLFYHDLSQTEPIHIRLQNLETQVRNFSLLSPLKLHLTGGLFGEDNFSVSCQIRLPTPDAPAEIRDLDVEMNLQAVNLAQLKGSLPQLSSLPVESLKGRFQLSAPSVAINASTPTIQASAALSDVEFSLTSSPVPVTQLQAELSMSGDQFNLARFSANLGQAQIQAQGNILHLFTQPLATFQIMMDQLKPEEFLGQDPAAPYLKGVAALEFKGGSTAPTLAQFADFLYGEGRLRLQDGMIVNMNAIQLIFQKISMIPGLVNKLQSNLPPEYQERLNHPHTYLAPIDQPFSIQNRLIYAEQIQIQTQDYVLYGPLQYQFDNLLRAQVNFELAPDLSQAFVASVKELNYLMSPQGGILIPVNISGKVPQLGVYPDLQYIGSRLAMVTAREFLGNILQTKQPSANTQTPSSQSPQPSTPSTQNPLNALLGGFLPQTQSANPGSSSAPGTQASPSRPSSQQSGQNSMFQQLLGAVVPAQNSSSSTQETSAPLE